MTTYHCPAEDAQLPDMDPGDIAARNLLAARVMRRLARARSDLLASPEFALLQGVIVSGANVVDWTLRSGGATNGVAFLWNPRMIQEHYTPGDVMFLVAHEATHCMLLHCGYLAGLPTGMCPYRVNVAMDHVVNNFLKECDPLERLVKVPPNRPCDAKYVGWSWRQVYADLPADANYDDADPFADGHIAHTLSAEQAEGMIQATAAGEAAQAAVSAGRASRAATALAAARADVETMRWRERVTQWMTATIGVGGDHSTWRRPNRRFISEGVYLPSRQQRTLREMAIAIDTSGSMSAEQLAQCQAHTREVCSQVGARRLHILYWDVGVARHETWDNNALLHSTTQAMGGGGTVFAPVLTYIKEQKMQLDGLIVMTDGYVSGWGSAPPCPALWLIDSEVTAPWGTTVRMPRSGRAS